MKSLYLEKLPLHKNLFLQITIKKKGKKENSHYPLIRFNSQTNRNWPQPCVQISEYILEGTSYKTHPPSLSQWSN